jgi:hypothetical protein
MTNSPLNSFNNPILTLAAQDGVRLDSSVLAATVPPGPEPEPEPEVMALYQRALINFFEEHSDELRDFALSRSRRKRGARVVQFYGQRCIVSNSENQQGMQVAFFCGHTQLLTVCWPERKSKDTVTMERTIELAAQNV